MQGDEELWSIVKAAEGRLRISRARGGPALVHEALIVALASGYMSVQGSGCLSTIRHVSLVGA